MLIRVRCRRYMRICGFAAEALKGAQTIEKTFPIKALQDFSARPRACTTSACAWLMMCGLLARTSTRLHSVLS